MREREAARLIEEYRRVCKQIDIVKEIRDEKRRAMLNVVPAVILDSMDFALENDDSFDYLKNIFQLILNYYEYKVYLTALRKQEQDLHGKILGAYPAGEE